MVQLLEILLSTNLKGYLIRVESHLLVWLGVGGVEWGLKRGTVGHNPWSLELNRDVMGEQVHLQTCSLQNSLTLFYNC